MFKVKILFTFFITFIPMIVFILLPQKPEILDQQATRYVELSVFQNLQDTSEEDISLVFRFRIRPPYHINSGSPLIEGLIPTTVELLLPNGDPIPIKHTVYPPTEILDISGFRTTVYYHGPHDLPITLSKSYLKSESIDYVFNYQACKDDECYAPEKISGTLSLSWIEPSWRSWTNGIELLYPNIFLILIFAFLGGLILNITPCVLPILSLKLFSLSTLKNTDKVNQKKHVAYHILGALTFFFIIAASVVGLQATGKEIGWGFQFQDPHYIFFITLVLGIFTLNLLGVFEIPFSFTTTPTSTTSNNSRGENLKNFSTGFLSVILATPCTVPFLGIAAAYSFSQGGIVVFLLHFFTALGFVAPYILILLGVDITRLLPQFRKAEKYIKKSLGFIIIPTIIWLIDIYSTLTEKGIALMVVLWLTAIILWAYGEVQKSQISNKWHRWNWKFWIVAIFLWLFLIAWVPRSFNHESNLASGKKSQYLKKEKEIAESLIRWEKFNQSRLVELRQNSKIIYVHFTADWCLNCKVNEKLVLEKEEVVDLFQRYGVVMLKADWTRSNDEILNEIQALGRAGIPLDVLYHKDKKIILSTILTVGEIESALKKIIL